MDRNQAMLLPPSVEEYVSPDNPVRAIDAYVQSLDMVALGFSNAEGSVSAGQPAYAPQALLKLYLYGYLMRVRSSRLLERETKRNLEVIWLVEGLTPCYKTIADFRKDNAKALTAANRDFVLLCKELDMYGAELVAIDGSFFRGNVAKRSIYTLPRLKKLIRDIEKDIEAYHQALDGADVACADTPFEQASPLAEKLEALKQRQAHYQGKLKQLNETGETQYAEVDPDARLLKKSGQSVAGYNVQIVIDSKHKLLVSAAPTSQGNDTGQLAPLASEAKTILAVETLEACADAGYYNQVQLKQCLDAGITPYVPIPDHHGPVDPDRRLPRDAFAFEEQTNCYRCPAGQRLHFCRVVEQNGKRLLNYVSDPSVCANCPMRNRCLSARTPYREIYRWEHEAIVEAHRRRMEERGADYLKQRAGLVEHPFGTLKRWCGWTHFLVRGKPKVRGEMNLLMLCYNFKRVMNILGMNRFLEHLSERANRLFPKVMDIPMLSIG
jgi:transposase